MYFAFFAVFLSLLTSMSLVISCISITICGIVVLYLVAKITPTSSVVSIQLESFFVGVIKPSKQSCCVVLWHYFLFKSRHANNFIRRSNRNTATKCKRTTSIPLLHKNWAELWWYGGKGSEKSEHIVWQCNTSNCLKYKIHFIIFIHSDTMCILEAYTCYTTRTKRQQKRRGGGGGGQNERAIHIFYLYDVHTT